VTIFENQIYDSVLTSYKNILIQSEAEDILLGELSTQQTELGAQDLALSLFEKQTSEFALTNHKETDTSISPLEVLLNNKPVSLNIFKGKNVLSADPFNVNAPTIHTSSPADLAMFLSDLNSLMNQNAYYSNLELEDTYDLDKNR